METRSKIAVACFIGGALTMAAALALTPQYWLFGLIAGIAGGYVSYEFSEVRKAIPVALCAVMSWQPRRQYWAAVGWTALAWTTCVVWTMGLLVVLIGPSDPTQFSDLWSEMIYGWLAGMILVGISALVSALVLAKADDEGCASVARHYREMNYAISPPLVLFWHLPRGIWRLPRASQFLGRFAWHLFKLIHSQKRVLCAIDGPLGGAMSYIWFVPPQSTFAEQALLVVCGGLVGSAFGVVNHEIVSKRLLHLPTADAVRA